MSVILENGFWTRAERDRYRAGAAACGAATWLHYLPVELGELRRRVAARNRAAPARGVVNPDDLAAWSAMFEPPLADECPVPGPPASGGR